MYEAAAGRDLATGENVPLWRRALSFVSAASDGAASATKLGTSLARAFRVSEETFQTFTRFSKELDWSKVTPEVARDARVGLEKFERHLPGFADDAAKTVPAGLIGVGERVAREGDGFAEQLATYAIAHRFGASEAAAVAEFKDGLVKFVTRTDYDAFIRGQAVLPGSRRFPHCVRNIQASGR